MNRFYRYIFIILIFSHSIIAQYNTEWVRTLDGPLNGWDETSDIAVDDSGNVYVTGHYITGFGFTSDFMTIKYNTLGELQWIKTLEIFPYDSPSSLRIDNTGDVIVSGFASVGYTTIKYSSTGDSLWTSIFYAANSGGSSIEIDDSNNIYLAGRDDYRIVLVKYNSAGVEQWYKHYSGPDNGITLTSRLRIDNAGFIYVPGSTDMQNGNRILLMKYNSNGDTIWTRTYGDSLYQSDIRAITSDAACNIYLTGLISRESAPPKQITMKYDSSGTLLWAKKIDPNVSAAILGVEVAADKAGNVYTAGYGKLLGLQYDFLTTKYNPDGDSIWTAVYNGTANNNDYLYDMVMDSSSNIYVTGGTVELNGGWNCITIMYDSNGVQQALKKFNGNGNSEDEGFALALDNWNNILVTGRTSDSVNSFDYLTIKYGPNLVEIKELSSKVPAEYILYQNYPNPFNPSTTFRYSIPTQSKVVIKVYDILGNEIATLMDEEKSVGTYELTWKAQNFSSGIYFYQLKAGEFVNTKKMILLK
jgi:hypothetical protein